MAKTDLGASFSEEELISMKKSLFRSESYEEAGLIHKNISI